MKRLLINILIFLCITLPPLYAVDYCVNKGLRKSYFTNGCLNDVYNSKANADMLIMGASRAKFQYSPKLIDSFAKINSYNIGVSGWPFHMQYLMFKLYIQHNIKPKYIVQNIDASLLNNLKEFYEYDQYIPYAKDTLINKYTKNLTGAFTYAELHFPLFIYNNHFNYIYEGLKSYFKSGLPAKTYKGYIPHLEKWDGTFDQFKKDHPQGISFTYNDTVLNEFTDFISYCSNNNIKVIFVYAPAYYEATRMVVNQQEMYKLYDEIANKYKIPILNYYKDSICYDKSNFMNSQHLNIKGSELFSKKLGTDLNQYVHNQL